MDVAPPPLSPLTMIYSLPSDTVVAIQGDIPTGLTGQVGVRVERASNGTVVVGRTTSVVVERPANSGNYVATFTAPAEADTYLTIFDWDPVGPDTTRVLELSVALTVPVEPSGLGPIADRAHARMGETFQALIDSPNYGSSFVLGTVSVIKSKLMTTPPATADEDGLDELVIDYLGKLVALELIPAGMDYWASQASTEATGNDPVETTSYPDRVKMLKEIQEILLAQTRKEAALAISLISAPRLPLASDGPAIDEEFEAHVTDDPRKFPRRRDFPHHHPRRTGVRL